MRPAAAFGILPRLGTVSASVHKSGVKFEEIGSYSRARRIGPLVWVAGTTAICPDGRVHAPGSAYAQTRYILNRIDQSLRALGARLENVGRMRVYLADKSDECGFLRAYQEAFAGIDPALTIVQAELILPELLVEIDVDSVVLAASSLCDIA